MEKVYLALDTAGLSAEKTKLESDCREGSAELRRAEVRGHTDYTCVSCMLLSSQVWKVIRRSELQIRIIIQRNCAELWL